jgi:hypothetical protein
MSVRPWLRRAAIVAFAILLPIAAHRLWDYIELRQLVREIERIRDKGEPVSESDVAAVIAGRQDAQHARQDNADSYYLAAAMLAQSTQSADAINHLLEWLAIQPPDQRTTQSLQKLVGPLRQVVDESHDALTLADRAGQLKFTGFFPGTEYSYRTSNLLSLYGIVRARSLSAAADGRADDAVDSVLCGLQLRRALRETGWEPFSYDEVGAVLSLSQPSAEALRRLQTALEQEDRPQQAVDNFLRQRAQYIDTVWRHYYGPEPHAPPSYTLPMRSVVETLLRPRITQQIVYVLRLWADLIDVARTPWPQKAAASAVVLERTRQMPPPQPFSVLALYGGGDIPLTLFARAVQPDLLIIDRSARTAVAVERFRRDHAGTPPRTLSELAPHYLAAVPADPFTGASLLYRVGPDAYTIYSVGPNHQDDGGDLTSELDRTLERGWGRRTIRGADIGVRVLMQAIKRP